MATHSSTLTWKIPWMEEPGRLQSMWSLGVGHDWATSLSLSFSVYSCHLFLISSASVSISVLYWAHFCMKCSLGISNFLEELFAAAAKLPQSCLTLPDPMDYGLPGSSVLGILQARILEWVVIFFSRRSSWPRDPIYVSCIADGFFTTEPPGKPLLSGI